MTNLPDYCGTGCQTGFGTCEQTVSQPSTDDFMCGALNGGKLCDSGLCCSAAGFCGNTTDYCDVGCQSAYGSCGASTDRSLGGTCGPNFGNAACGGDQCCSMAGYCGTTEDYCADPGNCMLGYGRCDSDATPAGESTANVSRPLKGSVTYSKDINDCVKSSVVALTYDDGPSLYTSQLLDVLKAYNFTATFFMTGNNNGKGEIDTTAPYPDLIKRMVAEGHQVASHTWSHYSLANISSKLRISQMVKNEMAINNIIGKWPTYMRPPYSQCDKASGCHADMTALGYHRILFDLDTQDYLNPSPLQIQNSKDIVKTYMDEAAATADYLSIQHDIVQQSVTNLSSYYFDLIQAKGWRGVTVGECLNDPEENWYRSFKDSTLVSSSSSSSSSKASSSASVKASTSVLSTASVAPTTKASSSLSLKASSSSSSILLSVRSSSSLKASSSILSSVHSTSSSSSFYSTTTSVPSTTSAAPTTKTSSSVVSASTQKSAIQVFEEYLASLLKSHNSKFGNFFNKRTTETTNTEDDEEDCDDETTTGSC